ncbi:hypothetical protein PoB_007041400 [Plakobranchus ocellatus]|uniref:C2H2-type domain-containing protein n=1 Tax=Plakobranchus ocellatus TaxID=259542 RepID=A0AAV4DI58_9GAST|nr:hypothetical protein PoB_007041400 [Plakobranchus ocellatus]
MKPAARPGQGSVQEGWTAEIQDSRVLPGEIYLDRSQTYFSVSGDVATDFSGGLKCQDPEKVLTTLLYGSETWVTYSSHIRLLERLHQCCLRTILQIHWSDLVTNVEVLEQAEIPSIEALIAKSQLRWAGHVFRMKDHRLPKIAMYGEIRSGHRYRGAPKKRYKDCLKKTFTACNIDHQNWSDYAADRSAWRLISSKGVTLFEETRRDTIKDKRSRRKARAASAVSPDPAFSCRLCSRACRSRIGLFSHERSCRQRGHSLPS